MANHCIDLICLDCGCSWCARGCNSWSNKPDPEYLKIFYERKQEWADKYANGDVNKAITKTEGDVCPACKSKNIAMD